MKFLTIRLGLFLIIFLSLSIAFRANILTQAHNGYFMAIVQPLHNIINPNIQATFDKETRTDRRHYGVAISLFNQRVHGNKVESASYRKRTIGDIIKYPNLHAMVMVPNLLLCCLILITPIHWKRKIISLLIGQAALFMTFALFFANAFEKSFAQGKIAMDSIWHVIIQPLGFHNAELIYTFVFLIWAIITAPYVIKKYDIKLASLA